MSKNRIRAEPFQPDPEQADLNADHERIAQIIERSSPGMGKKILVDILQEFAGTYIYFVQPGAPFKLSRDRWIISQFDRGCKVAEIARVIGMSEGQIWRILGRAS